jgi:ribosome maturation factor RimP
LTTPLFHKVRFILKTIRLFGSIFLIETSKIKIKVLHLHHKFMKLQSEGIFNPLFFSKMINKELIRKLAQERIDELDKGLFIVDISLSSSLVIHLEIDKEEGSVSINDCVSVSRNVEHNLDREEQDFELHVSSAGLDKPLRVLPQFVKNKGKEVDLVMKSGVNKTGVLLDVTAENLTLVTERMEKIEGKKKKEKIVEEEIIPMSDIKETKIVISFK